MIPLPRREFLRVGAGGAAVTTLLGAPGRARAQAKGKVKLAYLQLGWAATEIVRLRLQSSTNPKTGRCRKRLSMNCDK